MARYYTANGWRATEGGASPVTTADTGESLVQRGLLHPEALSMANLFASESPLLEYGLNPGALVRLTDGPGGVPRYATYYDVMMCNPWGHGTLHTIARGLARLPLRLYRERQDAEPGSLLRSSTPTGRAARPGRSPGRCGTRWFCPAQGSGRCRTPPAAAWRCCTAP